VVRVIQARDELTHCLAAGALAFVVGATVDAAVVHEARDLFGAWERYAVIEAANLLLALAAGLRHDAEERAFPADAADRLGVRVWIEHLASRLVAFNAAELARALATKRLWEVAIETGGGAAAGGHDAQILP